MRKICCAFLALIVCPVFLTACHQKGTSESGAEPATVSTHTTKPAGTRPAVTKPFETATETQTQTTRRRVATTASMTEPGTEPPAVTELSYEEQTARKFLSYLQKKDIKNIATMMSLTDLNAYSFLCRADITGYEVKPVGEDDGGFKVTLRVAKSDTPFFREGKSEWDLYICMDDNPVRLFKPCDKTLTPVYWNICETGADAFCLMFATLFDSYETIDDFNTLIPAAEDKAAYDEFCYAVYVLAKTYGQHEDVFNDAEMISVKDLEFVAERMLGVTGVDFTRCRWYDSETGTVSVPGSGVVVPFCSLRSQTFDPGTNRYTITLDYYGDTAYILAVKTVEYTVQKNENNSFSLLSARLLYDAGIEISESW